MKSAVAIALIFLLIWGLFGLADGHGFFGGIKLQFIAMRKFITIFGFIIIGAFLFYLVKK